MPMDEAKGRTVSFQMALKIMGTKEMIENRLELIQIASNPAFD